MYSLFGNKWLNLHGGPIWRLDNTEQGGKDDIEHKASSVRNSEHGTLHFS